MLDPQRAAAQAAPQSLLRTVLDRGHLIVGTGSTNAPWHFENDKGELIGMDIAMARILAKGLFDDETKVEFVQQDPAARIPNITTGKVDIVIQFMTMSPAARAARHLLAALLRRGRGAADRAQEQVETYEAAAGGGQAGHARRSCRTSMPTTSCIRRCRRRR